MTLFVDSDKCLSQMKEIILILFLSVFDLFKHGDCQGIRLGSALNNQLCAQKKRRLNYGRKRQ